ncbi:hypothetical protein RUM43_012176 [Polyplax serrata]|uniref:Uncharacterized protein n=1 Tax=Polyplax serrata TaxID=468196 RepID=A0AAN8NR65_POLSC
MGKERVNGPEVEVAVRTEAAAAAAERPKQLEGDPRPILAVGIAISLRPKLFCNDYLYGELMRKVLLRTTESALFGTRQNTNFSNYCQQKIEHDNAVRSNLVTSMEQSLL